MGNLGLSYIAYHPGDLIKGELEFRKISQKEFSNKIGISYTMLNEIMNEKRPVTVDFALLIEASLGINAELLVNMQAKYNLHIARTDKEKQSRWAEIRKVCAVL